VFLQLQKKHKIPKKNLNVENEAYQWEYFYRILSLRIFLTLFNYFLTLF
jgi:hypothetical protein